MRDEDITFVRGLSPERLKQLTASLIFMCNGSIGKGERHQGMTQQQRSEKNATKKKSVVRDKPYLRDGRAPLPANVTTSKVMRGNKAKDTGPELLLRQALYAEGARGYRLNFRSVPGRPDVAFTKKKIAIFVHGCFWHRCPLCSPNHPKSNIPFWSQKFERNQQRDREKAEQLTTLGWQVLTIWECQLKDNIKKVVQTIKDLL